MGNRNDFYSTARFNGSLGNIMLDKDCYDSLAVVSLDTNSIVFFVLQSLIIANDMYEPGYHKP